MRICVCGVQVPFAFGGAEMLVQSLVEQLRARGYEAETVALPFTWPNRTQLFKSCLAWRLLDLTEVDGAKIDLVIATRFPSYLVKHPNKVVWLVHQLRQAYDLQGTRYSDFRDTPRDRNVAEMLRAMDARTLSEARRVFSISSNVAERLERHNGMRIEALYPPPRLDRAPPPRPLRRLRLHRRPLEPHEALRPPGPGDEARQEPRPRADRRRRPRARGRWPS